MTTAAVQGPKHVAKWVFLDLSCQRLLEPGSAQGFFLLGEIFPSAANFLVRWVAIGWKLVAEPWKNGGVLFCDSFLCWNWPRTHISWLPRGPWFKTTFMADSAAVSTLVWYKRRNKWTVLNCASGSMRFGTQRLCPSGRRWKEPILPKFKRRILRWNGGVLRYTALMRGKGYGTSYPVFQIMSETKTAVKHTLAPALRAFTGVRCRLKHKIRRWRALSG